MSLFPGGRALIVAIPKTFDLLSELASARTIRLATAFAHRSGWDLLSPSVENSKADTFLITGNDFFQTEPYILHSWLKLSQTTHIHAALHTEKGVTFHPKVLIVEGQHTFAIVGSGNLSLGGLQNNVECGFFVESATATKELILWFDKLFQSSPRLSEALVLDYEKKWNSIRQKTQELQALLRKLDDELSEKSLAIFKHWSNAVTAARSYAQAPEFPKAYSGRVDGAARIKKFLRFSSGFDFELEGWKNFYSVLALGHLIPISRDSIFKQRDKLQSGLRALTAPNADVSVVLNNFLSSKGQFHISGLGLNTLSKILAVHDPQKWTVFNSPVEVTLRRFGYVPPRRVSVTEKFLAFCRSMDGFKSVTGLKDAFALDAFFFNFSREEFGIAEDPV